MSASAPFITDLPGRKRVLRDRDRPFVLVRRGAMLPECPDHAPAWACCPTIFTSSRCPGRASGGRPSTMLKHGPSWDDWPDPVPIADADLDVFEAWFGDMFDELFGPCR